MQSVVIFCLGAPPAQLDFEKLVRAANRVQRHYAFERGDKVDRLGDPGPDGQYQVADLARLIRETRGNPADRIFVGVVDATLGSNELFSAVDEQNEIVIISTTGNDVSALLDRTDKSYEAYVLTEIAAQLLTIEYRIRTNEHCPPDDCGPPWHRDTRVCLFDYCDDPGQTVKKLISPKICDICRGMMSEANTAKSIINACQAMVREGSWSRLSSLVRDLVRAPEVSFVFGGLALNPIYWIGASVGLHDRWVNTLLIFLLVTVGWRHWRRRRGAFV